MCLFLHSCVANICKGKKYDLRKGGWKKYYFQCNILERPLNNINRIFSLPTLLYLMRLVLALEFLSFKFNRNQLLISIKKIGLINA